MKKTVQMIRVLTFAALAAAVSAVSSCDYYWAGKNPVGAKEFATVRQADDNFCLILDKNDMYDPKGLDELLYRIVADKDGQRVMAAYYFDEDKQPGELLSLYKILTKDVYRMKQADEDSIGNDRVSVVNAWAAGGHINVQFAFYGSGFKSHFINLVVPPQEDETAQSFVQDGYLYLELRHNAYNDIWNFWYEDYVSFPIDWDEDSYKGCIIGYTNYYGQKVMLEVENYSGSLPEVPEPRNRAELS